MEYSTRTLETWSYAPESKTYFTTVGGRDNQPYYAETREELLKLAPPLEFAGDDIDLVSDEIKFLVFISETFFHFFVESLGSIYKLGKERPDALIVIYIMGLYKPELTDDMEKLLNVFLTKEKINYKIVKGDIRTSKNAPIVKANNAVRVLVEDNLRTSSFKDVIKSCDALVKCVREVLGASEEDVPPFRKVFITGAPTIKFDFSDDKDAVTGYPNDARMYDREKLETFFSSLGYEVVNPEEDFESIFHQILFMSQAKTLAAVTCSGLGNMFFMNPGQLVVEIQAEVTQLLADAREVDKVRTIQSVHTLYAAASFVKDHLLISIPSHRDPEKVIERIKDSKIFELL